MLSRCTLSPFRQIVAFERTPVAIGRFRGAEEALISIAWRDRYDPNELTVRLNHCKQVGSPGEVSFTGLEIVDYVVQLYGMLEFADAVHEIEARATARKSASRPAQNEFITLSSLMQQANRLRQRYLRGGTTTGICPSRDPST